MQKRYINWCFWFVAFCGLYWCLSSPRDHLSPPDSVSIELLSEIVARKCPPQGRLIIHIAKECSPVVSFGGVGNFLGELVEAQAASMEDTCIVVILPKYRFEETSRLTAKYAYMFKGRNVVGNLFHRYHAGITHIMIGAPSCYPNLWAGAREESAYDRPAGIQKDDRDLFFSFMSAEVVRLLKSRQLAESPSAVVHAHGATNVPVLMFLRFTQREQKIRLVYTVHDYNSEPKLKYAAHKIAEYVSFRGHTSNRCVHGRRHSFACALTGGTPRGTPDYLGRSSLGAEYFAACADDISTVSAGMIKHVMDISDGYAELLLKFRSEQRLWPISNWVTNALWTEARSLVPLGDTIAGKAEAKRKLFALFPEYGIGQDDLTLSEIACVIGWVGRFEHNKGLLLLPEILEAACESTCSLVIAGHVTSKQSKRALATQMKKMRAISQQKKCSFMLFADKKQQNMYAGIIRASQDIVIVPSISEAFGLVAAEALAYGTIPVVSEVGGLSEIVIPYDGLNNFVWTGFTFPLFDSAARTRLSLRITLSTAANAHLQSRTSGNLSALHERLIWSTPIRSSSAGGLQKYIRIYE